HLSDGCISPASTPRPGWVGWKGRFNPAIAWRAKSSTDGATMIQVLVIAHALLAVGLLGALTHQAFSVARASASAKHNIVDRFRGVSSPAFTNTIIILFIVTSIGGGLLYPRYPIDVRTTLEDW